MVANPPKDDPEITPAMIEAGSVALSEYDPMFEGLEEGAIRIFLAMLLARERCAAD